MWIMGEMQANCCKECQEDCAVLGKSTKPTEPCTL